MELTVDTAMGYLRHQVDETFPLSSVQGRLCYTVLLDPRFAAAPGSRRHHHAFAGGLCLHTAEVVRGCALMGQSLDWRVLLMAAIWHDYAKMHEYVIEPDGAISATPYRDQIGHVVGSVGLLYRATGMAGAAYAWVDAVAHCMLAHHGRREWGSPVESCTPEAWVLHAADMLSAQPKGQPA